MYQDNRVNAMSHPGNSKLKIGFFPNSRLAHFAGEATGRASISLRRRRGTRFHEPTEPTHVVEGPLKHVDVREVPGAPKK